MIIGISNSNLDISVFSYNAKGQTNQLTEESPRSAPSPSQTSPHKEIQDPESDVKPKRISTPNIPSYGATFLNGDVSKGNRVDTFA